MRVPWRNIWSLMGEPTQSTGVDGGVQGSVSSGNFSGPVGQGGNVTINIPERPIVLPEPPELIRDQIQDIWKAQVRESIERKDRQSLLDDRLDEIVRRMDHLGFQVYRAVILSTTAIVLAVVAFALLGFLVGQLFQRFGWL